MPPERNKYIKEGHLAATVVAEGGALRVGDSPDRDSPAGSSALKEEQVLTHELAHQDAEYEPYSLHDLVALPDLMDPQIAEFIITRYSPAGDVVCDPMDMGGTVPTEALRLKRRPLALCQSELAARVTQAKCEPIDIATATLLLQRVSFSLPVDLQHYREHFAPFFDVATFREIASLKASLARLGNGRESRFVEAAALGILHGHSASYLSASSSPSNSLAPKNQEQLNRSRGQSPCYRAVSPRLLRRIAMASRDCPTSLFTARLPNNAVAISDPRALGSIRNGAVGLVCTTVPMPGATIPKDSQWLRSWFIGRRENSWVVPDLIAPWESFMLEFLTEQARIVRPRGYAALVIPALENNIDAAKALLQLVDTRLRSQWSVNTVVDVDSGRTLRARTVAVKRQRVEQSADTVRIIALHRRP